MSADNPRPERVTLTDEERALVALIRAHDFSRMECADHEGNCCPEGGCHDIADHQYDHLARILAAREQALREEIEIAKLRLELGEWMVRFDARHFAPDLRRLVVIDPEDRQQVERLLNLSHVGALGWVATGPEVENLVRALREFANPKPPKPDEPTGLGAVVRDRDDDLWVRADWTTRPWRCVRTGARGSWDDIDVVEILPSGKEGI